MLLFDSPLHRGHVALRKGGGFNISWFGDKMPDLSMARTLTHGTRRLPTLLSGLRSSLALNRLDPRHHLFPLHKVTYALQQTK
jgi:hypothetical protein